MSIQIVRELNLRNTFTAHGVNTESINETAVSQERAEVPGYGMGTLYTVERAESRVWASSPSGETHHERRVFVPDEAPANFPGFAVYPPAQQPAAKSLFGPRA